ncbi:alpha/beta fold hydrolase [Xenophilus arseniciresistens]|uniref:Alpha/beta fold hydrolase n=1 Tax=Xenophilus arseniciresistens TaxID=1283306 RepID=A0AAE3N8G1_9BURK|nr:alpha/beta fold hydrolase [Xenophilus arseniciresistens]MDA7416808.1 alpha/beta fold hydrolase [Xenophilus arseniciresistens]
MPQLVLLPGLACDARLWEAQWPVLPAALDPVVSDASTRFDSIEEMAAAVLREHPGPLVLCGASMGGMVAMECMRQAPGRIAGVALLGTSAAPESPQTHQLRSQAIEVFARGPAALRELIELNVMFAFHSAQLPDRALTRRYVDRVVEAGAEQLIRQNRAVMKRPDARAHLGRYKGPVLLVCGEGDALTPPESMREIAALLPQAQLHWLHDCGHMLTMEKPAELNALLGDWLRQFAT